MQLLLTLIFVTMISFAHGISKRDTGPLLKVTTIEHTPFVTRKVDHYKYSDPNDKYEGYLMDLLRAVSDIVGFRYEVYPVPDGRYGKVSASGQWDGMIGELVNGKADLAVADLTLTARREEVIDFTAQYMSIGIGILFKKPTKIDHGAFWLINQFSLGVWFCIAIAYVAVSITLIIAARLSQCNIINKGEKFTVCNSFWFTLSTLVHQGIGLKARTVSTRIISVTWWLFTLFVICAYVAGLTTTMMSPPPEIRNYPISNAEDLAAQTKIEYGTLESGSTMHFFRESNITTYKKMWQYMQDHPGVRVRSYQEGVQKVLKGNYAYMMESATIEYMTKRNCDLVQIGGLLNSKGYGFATPSGSLWREKISLAILKLQEEGTIAMLHDRWWRNSDVLCEFTPRAYSPLNVHGKFYLTLNYMGGVFWLLMGGLAIALVVAIIEFYVYSLKNAHDKQQTIGVAIGEGLKTVFSRQAPGLRVDDMKVLNKQNDI